MNSLLKELCDITPILAIKDLNAITDSLDEMIPKNARKDKVYEMVSKYLFDMSKTEYMELGSRVSVYANQEVVYTLYPKFSDFIYDNAIRFIRGGKKRGFFNEDLVSFVKKNEDALNNLIDKSYDFKYDLAAMESFKSTYFLRKRNKVIESPQYLLLREALGIWYSYENGDKAIEEITLHYKLERDLYFTNSTPIKCNSACNKAPLISCFIQKLINDSIHGIGMTVVNTMDLQKGNGGVSTAIHELRANGSIIESSGRICDGVMKPLHIFKEVAKYVDQNKKRPGAHVLYLACYHPDIFDFIGMKNQFKAEGKFALELFYAIWCDQLFFDRVLENGDWYLMCPSSYPGLNLVFGEAFNSLYEKYVDEARQAGLIVDRNEFLENLNTNEGILDGIVLKIKARQLFLEVIKNLSDTGVPYILNKTQINECSNFEIPIEASNLCCEITLPFTSDMTAVCCLSSIKVSEFMPLCAISQDGKLKIEEYIELFDWDKFEIVIRLCVRNLNRVLDINHYPNDLAKKGASLYRPIGIGIQDLSSVFFKMGVPFASPEARQMNFLIQEFLTFHAYTMSMELAKESGPYPMFHLSKTAQGKFPFDHYQDFNYGSLSKKLDWTNLGYNMITYGLKNATLIAHMPTAGTSLICRSTVESVEPLLSVIYSRKFTFGEYPIINQWFIEALRLRNLLTDKLIQDVILANGCLEKIDGIPDDIKAIYASVYEIGMKEVIDHYATRQKFVCQSQSMNVYPYKQDIDTIYQMYKYAIESKLKTISYYFRGNTTISAAKNMVSSSLKEGGADEVEEIDEVCTSCSS